MKYRIAAPENLHLVKESEEELKTLSEGKLVFSKDSQLSEEEFDLMKPYSILVQASIGISFDKNITAGHSFESRKRLGDRVIENLQESL